MGSPPKRKGPLAGIRVIDLTAMVMGPYCTQIMADMGADVIKIEPPDGDGTRYISVGPSPTMGGVFANVNRGKRSIVLDLQSESGRSTLQAMVAKADVFIHSMRSKAIAKLGFSYEAVLKINPGIVYTNAYGYSRRGPWRDLPAYDDTIQAECGLTAVQQMLTGEPNYLKHYSHIGFQSYFVHPRMLETMDKLRFDCFRVGHVKERIEEMEPVIRNSHLFSFDIAAIAHAYALANTVTPNGLSGEEACVLMQYAGMSSNMQSIGIYGYQPENDKESLTAKQVSQMLWYLMDGISRGVREASLHHREDGRESGAHVETVAHVQPGEQKHEREPREHPAAAGAEPRLQLRTRAGAVRRRLHHCSRHHHGGGGAQRFRQIDAVTAAVPLL